MESFRVSLAGETTTALPFVVQRFHSTVLGASYLERDVMDTAA